MGRSIARLEQASNPNSCILLDTERDALEMPRVKLDWQLTDLDERSIKKTHELIGEEAGRVAVGRVKLMDWLLTDEPMWPSILGGGWHHMGTTRMHEDPGHGVVYADCKVHGLANLFMAGSEVFPTAGAANSTLSLVAMTLRLSDHLKEIMK
jgi:choline dehydrogenase-like flavoprotein